MPNKVLKVHSNDDLIVALTDLNQGEEVSCEDQTYTLISDVPAKHKFAARDFEPEGLATMYGITVGKATAPIQRGELVTTDNLVHAAADYQAKDTRPSWNPPDISAWKDRTFLGFHRSDERVGTANHWIVVPMVFCQNQNLRLMQEALLEQLGYGKAEQYRTYTKTLIYHLERGTEAQDLLASDIPLPPSHDAGNRLFPNVDGIKFLTHNLGCGGTRFDAHNLCGILAGYINHPNVAGATVMSLGCENAEVRILEEELHKRNPNFDKPLYIFTQHEHSSETELLSQALKHTFAGVMAADKLRREPAPISKLIMGVECGGSDGFSGISANTAIGQVSDQLVGLGGTVILGEFPELAGTEQQIADRCEEPQDAERFISIMQAYESAAERGGSALHKNPSPGNIKDGLITDAMKSAGAALKGGTAPIVGVYDYPEWVSKPGLNLLCTPGGDIESTTALAGAGATAIIFSTGLGTPTGNPVSPTLKVSSNTPLFERLNDITDLDAGPIITGEKSISDVASEILETLIRTASGEYVPKAVRLGHDEFIPWKRGPSL